MPTKRNDRYLYLNFEDRAHGNQQTTFRGVNLENYTIGVSLADYRRRIAMNANATTPFTGVSTSINFIGIPNKVSWNTAQDSGEYSTRFGFMNSGVQNFGGSSGSLPTLSIVADDAAKAMALKYYNKEINEIFSPFSSQIFAGEIKETLSLLLNPTKSLRRLYESIYLRKAGFDKLPNDDRVKAIASLWLEFRLGAMPLINDINSVLQILEGKAKRGFVKAYGEHKSVMKSTVETVPTWTAAHRHSVIWERHVQYFLKAGITQELLSYHKDLKEYLDADFASTASFAGTLYELAPFSWLLDYFVNIGDIISSLQNIQTKTNFTVQTRVVTYRETRTWDRSEFVRMNTQFRDIKLERNIHPTMITTRRRVDRSVIGSVIPPINFTVPCTPTQVANTIALFIQRML